MDRRQTVWLGLSLLVVLAAASVLVFRSDAKEKNSGSPVRTTRVTRGTFVRTIRLTGTTTAERFAGLIAPRLRGKRSPATTSSGGATSGSATTSATSSSTTAAAGSATQLGTGASSAGGAINASSAFRAATSRVGGTAGTTGSSTSSSSSNTSAGTSATSGSSSSSSSSSNSSGSAMGSSGLGSTSSQLYSGGGGGDDDFNLVLREVATAGSHVKKGDVVAEFDRQYMLQRLDDFKDAVTQNTASLKSQTANIQAQTAAHDQLVASAKADVEKAEFDMKTIPVLSRIDGERTKMALEQARAHYKQLVSETQFVSASNAALLKQSQLALAQSRLELADAQRNVDKMLVSAPMDGTVVMESMWRSGDRGQIKKGDQLRAGMRYMRIVDPTQMLISAVVNQADVALLRVGQKARVRFDAYPGLVLDAHIDSIPPATNSAFFRADYVRTVPVRLRLDESDSRIIPDLSVGIDVDVAQVPDALTVERAAIFTSSDGAGESEPHVFVQNGAAWVRQRVRLGLENNISAVVLEGLQPGDVVALDAPPGTQEKT